MRLAAEHHEIIISFAEEHPEIISNKFMGLNGKQKQQKLWEVLINQLNSLGYGILSLAEYKRRITDWKSKTKAKAVEINKSLNKTGGGEGFNIVLTQIEQRLLNLMGNKAYEGDNVEEIGFKKSIKLSPARSKRPPILTKKVKMYEEDKPLTSGHFAFSPSTKPFASPSHDYNGHKRKKIKIIEEGKPITSSKLMFSPTTFPYGNETSTFEENMSENIVEEIVAESMSENEDNIRENIEIVNPAYQNDHQYYRTDTSKETAPKKVPSVSTTRRRNLSSMSESIGKMNDETLNVLRSIDKNFEGVNENLTGINSTLKLIYSILANQT